MFSWCLASVASDESSNAVLINDLPDENCYASCETHNVFEHGVGKASEEDGSDPEASVSTAASSFREEGAGPEEAHKTLKLSFRTDADDNQRVDVHFHSSPLYLRFSKSVPLTVTGVGTEFEGSAQVIPSWVLTHVDDQPLDSDYKYAACQIRCATKSLPRKSCTQ